MTVATSARPPGSELWCCGSLHSAAIAVGTADFVTIILVTAHYVESTLVHSVFTMEMVAIVLVAVFLFFSSVLMLYGVVKKFSWLLLPWMILHLAAVVGSVIFCSIKFHDIEGQRAIPIIGTAIQTYFFLLIFATYVDLRKLNQMQSATSEEAGIREDQQHKNKCLIGLEVIEEKHDPDVSGNVDDTFTQLAFRDSVAFGDSEPDGKAFPSPDEVINLPESEATTAGSIKEEAKASVHNDSAQSDSQPVKSSVIPRRPATNSKSVANLGDNNGSNCALQPLLPPAKSEPKILASGSLTHVDNNFSPFRSKSAAQNGPKMKIFLPNHDDDDDDSDEDEDTSDEEVKSESVLPNQI